MFRRWLAHPLTRDLDLDDPRTTLLRREILRRKRFLRRVYCEWYKALAAEIPRPGARVLEVGSGAGFLAEYLPGLISSEIFPVAGVRCILDGNELPIADAALGAIVGTNVLHHVTRPRSFLSEAARCVRPAGVMAFVEPWVTPWSRFVYRRLHHEPFAPEVAEWNLPATGPLSSANGALPWIVFCRDRHRFEQDFPSWEVMTIQPMMPFLYLLSGGISLRVTLPEASFTACRRIEGALGRWKPQLAMFAKIVLKRTGVTQ